MTSAALLKHPRTQPTNSNPGLDSQSVDFEHLVKRIRPGQTDEVWTQDATVYALIWHPFSNFSLGNRGVHHVLKCCINCFLL